MITCHLCQEAMVADEMLFHLENDHAIQGEELAILEERREIRRKGSNELLATWKEISE